MNCRTLQNCQISFTFKLNFLPPFFLSGIIKRNLIIMPQQEGGSGKNFPMEQWLRIRKGDVMLQIETYPDEQSPVMGKKESRKRGKKNLYWNFSFPCLVLIDKLLERCGDGVVSSCQISYTNKTRVRSIILTSFLSFFWRHRSTSAISIITDKKHCIHSIQAQTI